MSLMSRLQTFGGANRMSALPRKRTLETHRHVCFGPQADIRSDCSGNGKTASVFRGKLEPAADHQQGPGNAHLTAGGSPHPSRVNLSMLSSAKGPIQIDVCAMVWCISL